LEIMKAPPIRIARPLLTLALAGGLLALAGPAFARNPRVAVLPFQGPAAERLRTVVVNQLARDCQVVSMAEIRRVAGSVNRPIGPTQLWRVVSQRLGLSAVIKGQITGGKRWQARLVVNQAQSGISVGSVVISDRRPSDLIREVARTAPARLVALVRRTQSGAAAGRRQPLMAANAGEVDAASPAATDDAGSAGTGAGAEDEMAEVSEAPEIIVRRDKATPPPMLEASIGPRAIFRALTFSDNYSGVPGYRLPGAPGVAGEVAFYPGARMSTWLSNVGLVGAFETSLGATTQNQPGSDPSPTRHFAYRAGVRARVPVAVATLMLGADYGEQHFSLQVPSGVMSPESHYGFFRPNIAGRVAFGRVSFVLSGGYLHILDAAGLTAGSRFPNATIRGGDAGATIGYAFDRGLQVQLGADYRRYAYTMNARQGDPLLVGGALDEYVGLTGLVTYRFR
jgi:hypothetical protein